MNAIYLRVSTGKQGVSGLGLEAQRAAIQARNIEGVEFVEVESGKRSKRPQLIAAVEYVKKTGGVLYIAKLDRLSRNVEFIFKLKREMESAGVRFEALDLPDFNTLTLGIFASFAQFERERISQRTKSALEAKKQREGTDWMRSNKNIHKTGGAAALSAQAKERNKGAASFAQTLRQVGQTLAEIAEKLTLAGIKTPSQQWAEELQEKGMRLEKVSSQWTKVQVLRLLQNHSS